MLSQKRSSFPGSRNVGCPSDALVFGRDSFEESDVDTSLSSSESSTIAHENVEAPTAFYLWRLPCDSELSFNPQIRHTVFQQIFGLAGVLNTHSVTTSAVPFDTPFVVLLFSKEKYRVVYVRAHRQDKQTG